MTRDCGHSTGDDQRLRTQYRRWPETADTVQEMARDCRSRHRMTVHRWSEEQVRSCRREELSCRPDILTRWQQKYR
ncbi:unnamed protein product, partial [Staurois parvus]